MKRETGASLLVVLLFVSMGSAFQYLRSPFSVSGSATAPSQVWNHNGLFWDPEYLSYVRAHLSVEPWEGAWNNVQEAANESLAVTPQPIRGAWYVPDPYQDFAGRNRAVMPLDESAVAMLQSADAYVISQDAKWFASRMFGRAV